MAARSLHHRAIYEVLTANGPDVDYWGRPFARLAGKVVKEMGSPAAVNRDFDNNKGDKIFAVLARLGMFGPASDVLRREGDKYY